MVILVIFGDERANFVPIDFKIGLGGGGGVYQS